MEMKVSEINRSKKFLLNEKLIMKQIILDLQNKLKLIEESKHIDRCSAKKKKKNTTIGTPNLLSKAASSPASPTSEIVTPSTTTTSMMVGESTAAEEEHVNELKGSDEDMNRIGIEIDISLDEMRKAFNDDHSTTTATTTIAEKENSDHGSNEKQLKKQPRSLFHKMLKSSKTNHDSTSTKILSPPPKKYFDNQSVKNFVKSKLGKFKINHGKDNNNISIITDSPSKRIKREHNLDPNCSKC
jgi:hypothetical protein